MSSIKELNRYFDHTILKPEADFQAIETLCHEALKYNFAAVCVNGVYVKKASEALEGSKTKVATVIGFPLGASPTSTKMREAETLASLGAEEIDMVISLGLLKSGRWDLVFFDIKEVVRVTSPIPIKVILETCLLTNEEKEKACVVSKEAGAAFVKTSTGFSKSGATEEDVLLMKRIVGQNMEVKASGGIRTLEDTLKMIKAGASRIGTSSSVSIMSEWLK